jgi:hypothetical protein
VLLFATLLVQLLECIDLLLLLAYDNINHRLAIVDDWFASLRSSWSRRALCGSIAHCSWLVVVIITSILVACSGASCTVCCATTIAIATTAATASSTTRVGGSGACSWEVWWGCWCVRCIVATTVVVVARYYDTAATVRGCRRAALI